MQPPIPGSRAAQKKTEKQLQAYVEYVRKLRVRGPFQPHSKRVPDCSHQ